MPTVSLQRLRSWIIRAVITVVAIVAVVSGTLLLLWRDRPSYEEINWPSYPEIDPGPGAVAVTWLGVTTLLFDDGETQLLIDGFISRPNFADVLFGRPVDNDAAKINYVLEEYRMRRVAAIIPVHSHYEHAMDIGAIANRTSASILGSETTANIARGGGVPEDQIVVIEDGSEYTFGNFTVTMIKSAHAPIAWGGTVPYAGTVDEPFSPPAPVSAWREGGSYSVVVAHPSGTTLVQGSAGFRDGALDDVRADVVMLGISMIEWLGRDYTEKYWLSLVTATGAKRVFVIHTEDFTRPFGEITAFPRAIEDITDVAGWLESIRDRWDIDTRLYLPEFGTPVILYPAAPET